jgi:hypothetical protein
MKLKENFTTRNMNNTIIHILGILLIFIAGTGIGATDGKSDMAWGVLVIGILIIALGAL